MGYEPKAFPESGTKTNVPTVEERLKRLTEIRKEAQAAHELARRRMIERHPNQFIPFKKGDRVWLDTKNVKMPYENRKLMPKREGPFQIKRVLGKLVYELEIPGKWRIHPVFHATLLLPYKENSVHGPNTIRPPPEEIEGEEEYEVESIQKHKKGTDRKWLYFVKWKGYSVSENTWEPESSFVHAKDILQSYKKAKKL